MKVRVKKLCDAAVIPCKAHRTDAGMDLVATSMSVDKEGNIVYGTGLAFEIPEGHVGLLFPRSSNAKKTLLLSNSVGVIDSGYRGEVLVKFKPSDTFLEYDGYPHKMKTTPTGCYEVGERIGQIIIMPYPDVVFEESEELSDTERGDGGYGSSGK